MKMDKSLNLLNYFPQNIVKVLILRRKFVEPCLILNNELHHYDILPM